MKLKVIQRGTHILPISEINNDRPNPAEVVADTLAEVEFKINELIKAGGAYGSKAAYASLKEAIFGFNLALNAAASQNWKLELESEMF